jgi:hypothetical protein
LLIRVIDVHGRQILHLLLRDAEPDTATETSHLVERDSHVLVRPPVPLFDKHMGHLTVARVDAERMELPDVAVGRVDVVAAALFYFARRDDVNGSFSGIRGIVPPFTTSPPPLSPAMSEYLYRRDMARHELGQSLIGGAEIPCEQTVLVHAKVSTVLTGSYLPAVSRVQVALLACGP